MTSTKVTFQKYPAYKDSGVEWLGRIPEHWYLKKMKFLGYIYPGINGKKGDDFSKEATNGMKPFIPFTNICNNLKIENNQFQYVNVEAGENQNRVLKNDILFLMSSETLDDIAKNSIYLGSEQELYLNSFCKGFRITRNEVHPEFINYLLFSRTYRRYFSLVGRGFTRVNLKQEYINDALTIVPPTEEQTAIATFLDEKTAKIDLAIAQKEKIIALLKERKQIIIQDLVTGKKVWNAAKNAWTAPAKVKDSGVEWIGEIPEEWEVKRLKNLIQNLESGVSVNASESESASENEIGVLKTSAVYKFEFDKNENKKVFNSDLRKVSCPVKKGRIIISRMNAPELVGASGLVKEDYPNLFLPDRLWQTVFTNAVNFDLNWLSTVLITKSFRTVVSSLSNGSSPSMKNISKPDFLNIFIPFPQVKEQTVIVAQIESQSAKIDKAIAFQEQQIDKLKELKSTLIDSAVTGKIKVNF